MNVYKNFYQLLKQLFVGEKIEGNSGYVNLYYIRSKYYEIVISKIQEFIENQL